MRHILDSVKRKKKEKRKPRNADTQPDTASSRPLASTSDGPQRLVSIDTSPKVSAPADSKHFAPIESLTVAQRYEDDSLTVHAKKNATVAWNGFTWLTKSAEPFVSGTPFQTPLAVINFLVETGEQVKNNGSELKKAIELTRNQLEMVNTGLLQAKSTETRLTADEFSRALVETALELDDMKRKGILNNIITNSKVKEDIMSVYERIKRSTEMFHSRLLLALDRKLETIQETLQILQRENWPSADETHFYGSVHNGCTPGTRVSTLKLILDWAQDKRPDSPSIFWLCGPAGSGKSTVAYSVCENLRSKLGASFFCSRQFPRRRDRLRIIPTIAKELAQSSKLFGHALALHGRTDRVYSVKAQAQDLLASPLAALDSFEPPITDTASRIVVIDALDELDGTEGSHFLKDFFLSLGHLKHSDFKFLITSREEPEIVELCRVNIPPDAVFRLQSIDEVEVTADIHHYLKDIFPQLRKSHAKELLILARRSRGLFVFAATAVRYAMPPGITLSVAEQGQQLTSFLEAWPHDTLNALPLDVLYAHIIHSSFGGLTPSLRSGRSKILGTIICALEPISPRVIAKLLEIDSETVLVTVQSLHAVMYSNKDGHVFLYHKSFADFLFDPARSRRRDGPLGTVDIPIQLNIAEARIGIVLACFRALQDGLYFNMGHFAKAVHLYHWGHADEKSIASTADESAAVPGLDFAYRTWIGHLESAFVCVNSEGVDLDIASRFDRLILLLQTLQEYFAEPALYSLELMWINPYFPSSAMRKDLANLLSSLKMVMQSLLCKTTSNHLGPLKDAAQALSKLGNDIEKDIDDFVRFATFCELANKSNGIGRLYLSCIPAVLATGGPAAFNDSDKTYKSVQTLADSPLIKQWKSLFNGLPLFEVPEEHLELPPVCQGIRHHPYGHWLGVPNIGKKLVWMSCFHYSHNVASINANFVGNNWIKIHKASSIQGSLGEEVRLSRVHPTSRSTATDRYQLCTFDRALRRVDSEP